MRRLVGALVVIALLLCLAPAGPSFPRSAPYEDVRLEP